MHWSLVFRFFLHHFNLFIIFFLESESQRGKKYNLELGLSKLQQFFVGQKFVLLKISFYSQNLDFLVKILKIVN